MNPLKLVLSAVLAFCAIATAQAQEEKAKRRLPEGFVARLGSPSLRHAGGISAVAFDPDGVLVASAGEDGSIRLWEVASGKEIQTFTNRRESVSSLACSPDGAHLVSVSQEGKVRVWAIRTGKEIHTFEPSKIARPVLCSVAFSPDGALLAAAGHDGVIHLWDTKTWKERDGLVGHRDWISSVAFAPNGKMLASWDKGGTIRLFGLASGKELHALRHETEGTHSTVALSPNSNLLVSAGVDQKVRVWDVQTGRQVEEKNHGTTVLFATFGLDNKLLCSVGNQGLVQEWQKPFGERHWTMEHKSWVHAVAFSSDKRFAVSGAVNDGRVRVWDLAKRKEVRSFGGHQDHVRALVFLDDKRVATAGHDKSVRIWEARTGKELNQFTGKWREVFTLVKTRDGKLIFGGQDSDIHFLDPDTGKLERTLRHEGGWISLLALSRDGKRLASIGTANSLKLWDAEAGKEMNGFKVKDNLMLALAYSPDGKQIAVPGYQPPHADPIIRRFDTEMGKELPPFPLGEGKNRCPEIHGLAYGPDGLSLAAVGTDGWLYLLDAATGKERWSRDIGRRADAVTFSPTEKILATGDSDGKVRLWDVATGEAVGVLQGHRDEIRALAFSPDGTLVASACNDATVVIWRVRD